MIDLYKILSGKYDLGVSNNFIQLSDHNANFNTRGHNLKNKKTIPERTYVRTHNRTHYVQLTDTWNLSDQVVSVHLAAWSLFSWVWLLSQK